MKYDGKYYLGLDIGTDSVGYAVTDDKYNLLKFHGEPAWGVTIFDQGALAEERRSFRSARRRLDRRQQRVALVQELFAKEIEKVDDRFFIRLQESKLYRDEVNDKHILFNDADFTDKEYYAKYPTIHHLICDLMESKEPHDVRLVYLACAWLVSHRGHFLSNISVDNVAAITDFNTVYDAFLQYFVDNGYEAPWNAVDADALGAVLKASTSITVKNKNLTAVINPNGKVNKDDREEFPFGRPAIIKLLAGGTVKLKDLYNKEEYTDLGSISLGMDDDALAQIATEIGEDFDIIEQMRALYDWSVLADALGDNKCISEAKVKVYEQHKKDLATLKYVVKKYIPAEYNAIFRDVDKDNYAGYAHHTDEVTGSKFKVKNIEDFSKFVIKKIEKIEVEAEDVVAFEDMKTRLESRNFMPKQKNTDNRVIPCQLYHYELREILKNAETYLPFLKEESDGLSVSGKIESIFKFKIPYFVGPLNADSEHAWLVRKSDKIYPWNFEDVVDLDASEEKFIQRMTNTCTYLPGEPVVPKDSLAYHRFTVLNEINNIRINGERISVELKQAIYNDLFMNLKKVTRRKLNEYLICNGVIEKDEEDLITGIDIAINSNLSSQIAFKQLLNSGVLTENDVERIIERASYAEDKSRLAKWLEVNYPQVSIEDRKYICRVKIKDFGRLSRRFLTELEGVCKATGEVYTILSALWNTQDNLMELLSDRYTFSEEIASFRDEYYSTHPMNLESKLDEMYVSNAVRRPIYRTLAIVKDVEKAFGKPAKIFVETTRSADDSQKGKRTKSRKDQILDLYKLCRDEEVKLLKQQLDAMGEYADNKLQGDKLFLYYMQLGRCMYTGEPIELEKLGTKLYDIDHIYPQAVVQDDSILNNKVLCLSTANGEKSDTYPIKDSIRHDMYGFWSMLNDAGLITDEKYKRLKRATPFTDDEKWGFINRQLTETSQSTKAVASVLNDRFPDAEIVYSKAKLVSDFRHQYGLLKSRTFNDLHHAKDAYLNIVVGNVYNMKFTKRWFSVDSKYSMKTTTLFSHPLVCNGVTVWNGEEMLTHVKKTVAKNNAHFTKYSYFKTGGLFDQMPVAASDGLAPLKKGLDTSKYGGYNKSGAMFYIPVRYKAGKKSDILIMSVEMQFGKKFLADAQFAEEYSFRRLKHILGKPVDEVSFPMGMRPWKVNTMLELDGFRVCIAGIGSGGKCLIAQPVMQFAESIYWNNYIKRIERFVEKCTINKNYIYDEECDKVSKEKNLELYDVCLNKFKSSIWSKRVNAPLSTLEKGRCIFAQLDIKDQTRALSNIMQTFGRVASGCDLTLIGGAGRAAACVNFSSTVSNWGKNYSCVRIIDSSTSGLWISKSDNLLELL
ncbi:MAG: type II CRISPR RNA-guided endonuclease Cas9 [Firmicutes bacterium]|nr:type II CRISPR RNA-guided endonuclease Cas9 [Bacillota bacterium]